MRLKPKQKEDLARAALRDGLIFAWDTGLGKTLGGYLWSLLKVGYTVGAHDRILPNKPVLVVAPGDGFEHWKTEGQKLRIELVELNSQDKFLRLSAEGRNLPPGFYFSSYSQLTRNNMKHFPSVSEMPGRDVAERLRLHNEWSESVGQYRD